MIKIETVTVLIRDQAAASHACCYSLPAMSHFSELRSQVFLTVLLLTPRRGEFSYSFFKASEPPKTNWLEKMT